VNNKSKERRNIMKKINFGIVLIVIVLVFLTIFVVYDESSKIHEKDNIKETLKGYLDIYNKYSMLKESDRNIDNIIDANQYNDYLQQMKQDLSKYVSNDKIDKIYEQYKQRLDQQFAGLYIMKEYNKKLVNIVEFTFNESYVSIIVDLNMTINRDERAVSTKNEKTSRYEGKVTNLTTTQRVNELIVLKKIGNEYKVIMHNIADLALGYTEPNIPMGGII
jgi:hypothetical protein